MLEIGDAYITPRTRGQLALVCQQLGFRPLKKGQFSAGTAI
jgi:hypothetical protein